MSRHAAPVVGVLLGAMALLAPASIDAQENGLSLGTVRTPAKTRALRLAVRYATQYTTLFGTAHPTAQGTTWFWDLSPDVAMLTGSADALQSLVVKLTGNIVRGHTKQLIDETSRQAIPGLVIDLDRVVSVFPVSAGVETDGSFHATDGIVELGYVPIWPGQFQRRHGIGYKMGVFVQGGYAFAGARTGDTTSSGGEPPRAGLLRAKASGGVDVTLPAPRLVEGSMRVLGTATGWYDVVRARAYHRLNLTLRLPIVAGKWFDVTYEKGSGAPVFDAGEQVSANLTLAF